MSAPVVHEAVVLAAGRGSRLGGPHGEGGPKPLTIVAGLTLLTRTLLTLRAAGVTRAIVVVGHRGDELRAAVARDPALTALELVFVENTDWEKQNGLSVLAARDALRGDAFFLTMADHVFARAIPQRLVEHGAPVGGLSLAVDADRAGVFDLDDATKVRTRDGDIVAIGKSLPEYDRIDTGVFLCTRALLDALAAERAERGDASLSDGVARLARAGLARAVDVTGALWQDVDTPETLREAERRLFASLVKAEDGLVSRHLNRPISLAISRFLCRTRVRPNHVTAFVFVVGALAGVCAAMGQWAWLALGGFLYQWKSILDGVDGELARLKFQGSPLGQWLDTLVDDSTNWLFYGGVAVGAYRSTGDAAWLWLGAGAVLIAIFVSAAMYRWIWTRKRTGDLLAFEWFWERGAVRPTVSTAPVRPTVSTAPVRPTSLGSRAKLLAKQDFFCFFFFVLCLANVAFVIVPLVLTMGVALSALLAVQYAREQVVPDRAG